MGIYLSKKDLNFVDKLIDKPKECPEYLGFCTEITKWCDYYRERRSTWPFKRKAFDDLDGLQSWLKNLRRCDLKFFCKLLYIGHDTSRSKRAGRLQAHIQLKYLRPRGTEHMRAWYLHHALDCIEKLAVAYPIEEILSRLEERTKACPELETVKNFIKNNSEEILHDYR